MLLTDSKSTANADTVSSEGRAEIRHQETLLKTGALQKAIFNSANFSSIATDAKGVIQIFNVGAERMLGYAALEVVNKITPADISDPQELIARAETLSIELGTQIEPGFEALVFKASRGIEDIYELTYIRKDGSRFPAMVSVTALRDEADNRAGGSTKADGTSISLIGKLPVSPSVNLLGKLGTTYGRTDVSANPASGIASGSESGWGVNYGIGAEYMFSTNVSAALQYDEYRLKFAGQGRDKIATTSLGLRYNF